MSAVGHKRGGGRPRGRGCNRPVDRQSPIMAEPATTATDPGETSTLRITVLAVTPARAGKLFALAAVAIDIDGVLIEGCPYRKPKAAD